MKPMTHKILFPNGSGERECSKEYYDAMIRAEAIKPAYTRMDSLSPEDYEEWNRLDNKMACMAMSGEHLGKITKY